MQCFTQIHARPQQRACQFAGLSAAAWYRPPIDHAIADAPVREALTQVVQRRPSGFWTCCALVRRQHPAWNHKRLYRVYKAMNLHLIRAAKRRLPKRQRLPWNIPTAANQVWSVDFMSDAVRCGRRLRTFNVIDDVNRELVHVEVDTSISSARLVRVFEQMARDHGLPKTIGSDNGPAFLGEAFTQWAKQHCIELRFIQPGKPNQNALIERFNRTFREEVLDPNHFDRIDDLRQAAWWWQIDYNENRPHDALGGMTPAQYRLHNASHSILQPST